MIPSDRWNSNVRSCSPSRIESPLPLLVAVGSAFWIWWFLDPEVVFIVGFLPIAVGLPGMMGWGMLGGTREGWHDFLKVYREELE